MPYKIHKEDLIFIDSSFEEKSIRFIRKNKSGLPCLWENLKEYSSMKKFVFIFNSLLQTKKPIYINTVTESSLVMISEDDLILKIFIDENGIGFSLFAISNIDKYSNNAILQIICRKSSNSNELQYNKKIMDNNTSITFDNLINIINSHIERIK